MKFLKLLLWRYAVSLLLVGVLPRFSLGQTTSEPTTIECEADEAQCPVSLACYSPSAACDSYDDCGTGFDETGCESALQVCTADIFSAFTNACTEQRADGVPDTGLDLIINGEFVFTLPSIPGPLWIDKFRFTWDPWGDGEVAGDNYYLVNISTLNSGIAESSVIVPFYLTAQESVTGVVKDLRAPLYVDVNTISEVVATVSYVANAVPGPSNQYTTLPDFNYGSGFVEFVR